MYGFRSLRGLWGFCARVELGGLKACGVFAPIYPFICLSFCPCCLILVILPILSIVALCGLVLGFFRFFFPFGLYAKREGAKCCPLRPLFVCCGFVYKSLNITVISCGSSFPYLLPLQMIPATSSGCFVGSFTVCPSLSIVEYLQ